MEDNDRIEINRILEYAKTNDYMTTLEEFLVEYAKTDYGDVSSLYVSNFQIYYKSIWSLQMVAKGDEIYFKTSGLSLMSLDEAVAYVSKCEKWDYDNERHGSCRR